MKSFRLFYFLYFYDPEIPNVPRLCGLLRASIHSHIRKTHKISLFH